jgi:transposase
MNEQSLESRLERIESLMQLLLQQKLPQKYYSTAQLAKIVGKSVFTVREWCRLGRVRAEKRPCGRGNSQEWMISHEELERFQAEGLLLPKYRV